MIDFWEDLNSRDSAVDGGCLLSTTYGDATTRMTRAMREFRDDTLNQAASADGSPRAVLRDAGPAGRWPRSPARIVAGIALLPLIALALLWHLLGLPALLALVRGDRVAATARAASSEQRR